MFPPLIRYQQTKPLQIRRSNTGTRILYIMMQGELKKALRLTATLDHFNSRRFQPPLHIYFSTRKQGHRGAHTMKDTGGGFTQTWPVLGPGNIMANIGPYL